MSKNLIRYDVDIANLPPLTEQKMMNFLPFPPAPIVILTIAIPLH